MAIQITHIKNVSGQLITFENAYGEVTADYGNKTERSATLTIYTDSTKTNVVEVIDYTFIGSVDDGAPNFIKQAYNYLKTRPEYSSAIDV